MFCWSASVPTGGVFRSRIFKNCLQFRIGVWDFITVIIFGINFLEWKEKIRQWQIFDTDIFHLVAGWGGSAVKGRILFRSLLQEMRKFYSPTFSASDYCGTLPEVLLFPESQLSFRSSPGTGGCGPGCSPCQAHILSAWSKHEHGRTNCWWLSWGAKIYEAI